MSTLKEIENRYYKECKVIMLPTENESIIWYNEISKKLVLFSEPLKQNKEGKSFNPINLYITSDDEIKEGDWFISSENQVYQATKANFSDLFSLLKDLNYSTIWKAKGKVISTTNKSLKKWIATDSDGNKMYNYLPQPSQSFIKKYCKLGGIDEVLIEYTTNELKCYKCGKSEVKCITTSKNCLGYFEDNNKPKVNSHNEITIHPIKNSWNRDEVVELLKQYQEDFCNFESIKPGLNKLKNTINLPKYWKDWINKNL